MNILTDKTIKLLENAETRLADMRGLIGLDGFVDQIVRVVDKLQADGSATYITKIEALARRIQAAAGKSTKFDLSVQQTKLGGNGPIMANALAQFSLPLTCLGNLSPVIKLGLIWPLLIDLEALEHRLSVLSSTEVSAYSAWLTQYRQDAATMARRHAAPDPPRSGPPLRPPASIPVP